MKLSAATALTLATLLAGTTAGMATGGPVMLSAQQRMIQEEETAVLNWLSARGFNDVTNLHPNGNGIYGATVMKNGQPVQVTVDVKSGAVTGI
jgi:hypothetical protein